MRWRWTRWIGVASTSAPPAGRSTRRRMAATTGRQLCETCRLCFPSRSRPCHDCGQGTEEMIRVELPGHLRTLAKVDGEVLVEIEGPATQRSVLDALEANYPVLRGTIRDHESNRRRPFLRFFACEQDLSH